LQTIKWNTLSFLGASNLIGNPISLINTLGTGVEEFFYEPYQGFMRGGAAEGALGIVSGTGSLFKNTSLGLVGSLGKIGSSISAGILSITGDEEFI
jgi:vacuolar protein sorting-associated protein 13A/C